MLGVHFAGVAGTRHATRLGLDLARVQRMSLYCGIGGLLGAHYVDLFCYQPDWIDQPDAVWRFLDPFAGISSYGGLLGGTLGFLLFARKERGKRLRYADAAMIGVVVLMTFGRAGCASVHDHVGIATSFPLAVDFPAGSGVAGPHHDLGLYEFALWCFILLPLAIVLARRVQRAGVLVGVVSIGYAVPRFGLDFLRREADNPRYAGLTPAQWACIVTVLVGIALLYRVLRDRSDASLMLASPQRRTVESSPHRRA
jgi:phosphatidylglycerol:prolipoprotein diacylglycerol transferase